MTDIECHGLDTPERVCFYEQDFYVLSNFSSFSIMWKGWRFDTAEAVYHWEKFGPGQGAIRECIRTAPSAHEAFGVAQTAKALQRPDWDEAGVDVVRAVLRALAGQHEIVRRAVLAAGDSELNDNLWMELRAELRGQGSGRAAP